jgi:hypothetical protein
MPENPINEELAQQASFIFKGTVKKAGAATMRVLPVTNRTAIVQVDEVLEAPDVLADYAGQKITVELGGRKQFKVNEQYLFYGNGWVFGDGLAVQSLAHELAGKTFATAAPTGKPTDRLHQKLARARFETADIVVMGRVTSVRVPPETLAAAVAAILTESEETPVLKPISEHDPVTQEAVIEVEAVHKGGLGVSEVTLRFPRSTDVRWYQAPKFSPGQQGFFMLHQGEEAVSQPPVRGAAISAALAVRETAGFHTALHSADFQPLNEPGGVREILGLPDVGPVAEEN